jgi:flagellar protein FlbB
VATERSYSKKEWVLYILVLPLFFTMILSFFILQWIGYNVTDRVTGLFRQIPVVKNVLPSSFSTDTGTPKETAEVRQLQKQVADLTAQINELQRQRDSLLQSQDQKDALISQLRNQIFTLQKQLDDRRTGEAQQKETAAIYEDMSPGKAAAILEAMPVDQARNIFAHLSTDAKASILEKMDPAKVSQFVTP